MTTELLNNIFAVLDDFKKKYPKYAHIQLRSGRSFDVLDNELYKVEDGLKIRRRDATLFVFISNRDIEYISLTATAPKR